MGRRLKNFRVGVSLVFATLTVLLFGDVHGLIAPALTKVVLYPQFVPSLLQFTTQVSLAATGGLLVLVLTLLLGRVYCSTLCPLGTLQDCIGRLARKKGRKASYQYTPPHHGWRYGLLALTLILLLSGSGLLLHLLDPFSSFGRLVTNLLRPLLLFGNNLTAVLLELADMYALPRLHWAAFAPAAAAISLATLLLIIWLAATHGRLYCNTICPVGTLLGLFAKISWLRITIDQDGCKGCKRCEHVCKAGCIDSLCKTIDSSRCVSCWNCLAVCQNKALHFARKWPVQPAAAKTSQPNQQRRLFLHHCGILLFSLAKPPEPTRHIIQNKPTTIAEQRNCPVSPPGSRSIAHFTATCTACHLCVSVCPSRVLVPSLFEFGATGLLQPRMNNHFGHCNYDCTICLELCPSGALLPLTVEQKKLTQLGVAKFIKENCVVATDYTACGACSEHCPTKAVDMVFFANPLNKDLKIPEIKPDFCIGCGACEHACPTRPYRAIFVDGHAEHQLAKKPLVQKIEAAPEADADFPF